MGAACLLVLFCTHAPAAGLSFPLEAKWSVTLPAPLAFPPAFDGEYAYVPLRTNQLAAHLIKDGTVAWSVECPMTAAPAAGGGLVFAGSDGAIEARAQADGRAVWRRPIQGRVMSLYWDAGWLLASLEAGHLVALRAADGEILWQRDLGAPLQAAPAPAGDRVYLALKDGRILALSLQTGEDIWTRTLTEAAVGMLPVVDRIFVSALDNQLHALDARDGDADWEWRAGADLLGLPALDERRVYFVALDNVLRGHNRNSGSMEWKQVLPMRPFTGPLLSGQTLIVAGVASELRGYNSVDGKPAGDFVVKGVENEEILLAAPPHLTQQDLLILITKGGQMRAVGTASAAPPPAEVAPPVEAPATPEP